MSVPQPRMRLILSLAFLASAAGVIAWLSMPREEDPRLARRGALAVAVYPGADVLRVERVVAGPIEDELSEVSEIERLDTTIREGIAIINIRLVGTVTDPAPVWDEVDQALVRAHSNMPEGVPDPTLNRDLFDTEAVLVAITGSTDRLVLADAADALESAMLSNDEVSRVLVTGDPGEQIVIDVDDASARQFGVSPSELASWISGSNSELPAGSLRVGGRRLTIRPGTDFSSVEDIESLLVPIPSADGQTAPRMVRLDSIARIARRATEPVRELARHDGQPAVLVGAVPISDIHVGHFGEDMQALIDDFAAGRPELGVSMVAFQPARVEARLSELGSSLLLGVGIIAGVLILLMGFRMGIVVASVVPLVTFASLAVYAFGGGVLHQMTVAALVIALGLLVDNAIVVAETMQRRLDEGQSPQDAMRSTISELRVPLAAATGTTLASFVPMLLAEGNTGDFTRAIPTVVMLTLAVSYFYALWVTPILARYGLRPAPAQGVTRVDRLAGSLGAFASTRPWTTVGLVALLMGASGAFAGGVERNFFPASDRNQLVVAVTLPEGTHIDETDALSSRLERFLMARGEVTSVSSFVGRSTPRFYYNLPTIPSAPHVAQVVVGTQHASDVGPLAAAVEEFAAQFPQAQFIAKRLEQGPPTAAPIELLVFSEDLRSLHETSEALREALRATRGTHTVRTDVGLGSPTLRFDARQAELGRLGVPRETLASTLLGHAQGWPVSTLRSGEDPVPIILRASPGRHSAPGERIGVDGLVASDVPTPAGTLPVAALSDVRVEWLPSVLHHQNGRRVARVLSESAGDESYASVYARARPALEAVDMSRFVHDAGTPAWQVDGSLGESSKANKALSRSAPLAALLLIAILLAEFNSFRRLFIVLSTAPLAALGIWPGLYLLGLPFGFVALLGAIALIGIAVNGAIVLLDVTEQERAAGATIEKALTEAVRRRTRPILLTTATTVAGLMPLLFSESTLWPPMAAAMISGLCIATGLTLAFVPALYRLLFREPEAHSMAKPPRPRA